MMTYKDFKCKKTMKSDNNILLFKKNNIYSLNTYLDCGGICETEDYVCLSTRKIVKEHFKDFKELGE